MFFNSNVIQMFDEILGYLRNTPIRINTGIWAYVILGIFMIPYLWNKYEDHKRVLAVVVFIYLCGVFEVTMLPLPLNHQQVLMNASGKTSILYNTEFFFISYYRYGTFTYRAFLGLNVLMLVPFGFLMHAWKPQRTWLHVVFLSLLFSLTIEMTQLICQFLLHTNRIADVNDVLANTIGGGLGSFIWICCENIVPNIRKRVARCIDYFKATLNQ